VIPHGGAWQYWLFLCGTCATTSRHRADQFAARSPRYGFDIGNLMLIFLIGLAFSVVAPLVLPATLLFFAVNYVFWRYVLLYVYVRKYESGGRMFPVFFNQLMICLAIFHVFTTSVMVVKGGYWQVMGGGQGWEISMGMLWLPACRRAYLHELHVMLCCRGLTRRGGCDMCSSTVDGQAVTHGSCSCHLHQHLTISPYIQPLAAPPLQALTPAAAPCRRWCCG
jgi:hypothetical protein